MAAEFACGFDGRSQLTHCRAPHLPGGPLPGAGIGHAGEVSRYAEAKPYAVPDTLSELTGPVHGLVRLPRHLDWGPEYAYDLDDDADLAVMYERVVREAQSAADLQDHLDGATLQRLWPLLIIPAPARARWEQRFPQLRRQATAA